MHKHTRGVVATVTAVAIMSVAVIALAVGSNGSIRLPSGWSFASAKGERINSTSPSGLGVASQAPDVDTPIVDETASAAPSSTSVLALAEEPSGSDADIVAWRNSKRQPKPQPKPAPIPPPSGGGQTLNVEVTFYGAYDNDPKGSQAISNPVIHQLAGGVGSYADPLTFASPSGTGAYPIGTIIYVPFLQKYFIKEDQCATSWTAPNGCGATSHVDLYMGNPSTSSAVIRCEENLTPDGNTTIIVNPAANLVYDATPLWNQSTGACARMH